jgi:cytochrome P450
MSFTVSGLTCAALFFIVTGTLVSKLLSISSRHPSLPPGPPTVPLLGNLDIFPTEFAHYKFTEWARQYGDIYSLKIGPKTAVVITSMEVVKELMEKRSGNTADRPPSFIVDKVTGGLSMVLARYGHEWRVLRKTAHAILTPSAVTAHLPIQLAESVQVMYDLLKTPEYFYTHIRRYSNSVIMSVLYGKRCPRYETREATLFFEAQHLWELSLEPGAHPPIDVFPFLQHIPRRWAPWKKLCEETRKLQRELYFGLMDECEERVRKGKVNDCYMEEIIRRKEEFGLDRELAGYFGGVMIEGGSDTTSSFLQSLILLLVAFPNIQQKAHEEMDRVVGDQRTPDLDDIARLPYIQALVKETHRMRPVAPLAVPHANREEEQYRGYVIPKGSTIFVNVWGMFHDPNIFEDPETFNPDRYLNNEHGTKAGVDNSNFRASMPFGSGRRLCPGIHLANNSLILNTMNLVWGFSFECAVNPTSGHSIAVDIFDYEKGILTAPKPFKCKITCRSSKRAEIIEREFRESIHTFERFEGNLSETDKTWLKSTRESL